MKMKPVEALISIQKVQGIAKRNNIRIVDKTRENHPRIACGVAVRKHNPFNASVTIRFYNYAEDVTAMVETMSKAMSEIGFELVKVDNYLMGNTYRIEQVAA